MEEGRHLLGRSVGKNISTRLVRQQHCKKNHICLLSHSFFHEAKSFCFAEMDDVNYHLSAKLFSSIYHQLMRIMFEGGRFQY